MHTNEDRGRAASGQSAVPLVILPGLLCDSRMFQSQIEAFAALCVDGFYGAADRIGDMADYALERMPARCALLGHSMGARVALEIWRRAPERIDRLALANTGVHDVGQDEAEKRRALRDLGRDKGNEALVNAWLPPMIGASRRDDPVLLSCLEEMTLSAGTPIFAAQIEALLHRPAAVPVLGTIDRPTFVIASREDSWSPVDQLAAIAAAIPHAQLRVLEGAGHMAPAENPAGFNKIIGEWLAWPAGRDEPSTIEESV